MLARPKARADQRHNGLSRQQRLDYTHNSLRRGHPTHEEVQYEAQIPWVAPTLVFMDALAGAREVSDRDIESNVCASPSCHPDSPGSEG